jgi:beta-N-acetylhexosaminidase
MKSRRRARASLLGLSLGLLGLLSPALFEACAPAHAGSVDGASGLGSELSVAPEAPSPAGRPETVLDASSFWTLAGTEKESGARALLAAMSDVERLGQLFMLSYGGDEPTALLYAWIRERGLGGIKIFGWNGEDTRKLSSSIRAIQDAAQLGPHDVPPFIATDQEGGWVRHVKGGTSITPGNMAIGASAWVSDAYRSALYIGRELSALGITMNFAPTVDLATRPDSSIIGSRAFSSDPTATAILAAAWTRGMADSGVAATAKHFPGHGDTSLDSHGVLPVITIDEATLWERELLPYRLLAAEGIPGIMSGHLAFPAITGGNEPASLSYRMIQGLLRERMGYDGLVITDDLMMNGAASSGGLADTCERAIRAGNDILMFSRTLGMNDAEWTKLLGLYRRDPSFRARVDESALRVLRAKLGWLLPRGVQGIRPISDPEEAFRLPESLAFFQEQARRSATLLGERDLPAREGERLLVAGQFSDFFAEAGRAFPGSESFRFSYLPGERAVPEELDEFKRRLRAADGVVVCVANPASASFAREAAEAGKKLYVASVLSPVFAAEFASGGLVVAVYSYAAESFKAAFGVLSGQSGAVGRLPVSD